jgi:TetR/AcrR family tetracycline transcriptional repressor
VDTSHSPPRPGRHTRHDVLAAALALLEDHGLTELTMRRLAAQLGVQPSALYWHVPNKQQLLAELADRIVARTGDAAPGADWRTVVLDVARRLRGALLSCRDGAEVVSSSLALGLGGHGAQQKLREAMQAGRVDEHTADAAAAILVHQILGQVWHEQQRRTAEQLGVAVLALPAPGDLEEQVDLGVTLILAGLDARGRGG